MENANRRDPNLRYTKVNQLRPWYMGYNLRVKVVKVIEYRGSGYPVADFLVGDETGMIIFTARFDQVFKVKPGATLDIRNVNMDIHEGALKLTVDRRGFVDEIVPSRNIIVCKDNNLSDIKWDRINCR